MAAALIVPVLSGGGEFEAKGEGEEGRATVLTT